MSINNEKLKYAIFQTAWGFFGLLGTKTHLLRTTLPEKTPARAGNLLLKGLEAAESKSYMKPLQKAVIAYYIGTYDGDFSGFPIDISGLPPFSAKILKTCRKIKPGKTLSYSQLAKAAGSPKAARAAGRALAKNPMPLIIPCHRIIGQNGKLTGFSAAGGIKTKQKMLALEKAPDPDPFLI